MKITPKMYETSDGVTHCEGWNGNDFTLCGFTLDGDQGPVIKCDDPTEKINCDDCRSIIKFCRSISGRAISRR